MRIVSRAEPLLVSMTDISMMSWPLRVCTPGELTGLSPVRLWRLGLSRSASAEVEGDAGRLFLDRGAVLLAEFLDRRHQLLSGRRAGGQAGGETEVELAAVAADKADFLRKPRQGGQDRAGYDPK